MRNALMIVLFSVATLVGCASNPRPAVGVQSPPLFQAGQQYIVLAGCAPQYFAVAVAKGLNTDPGRLNPCWGEVVTVQQVRSDGWLLVTDVDGNGWTLNPHGMYAFRLFTQGLSAAR